MHAEIQEVGGTVRDVLQWAEQEVDMNAFNTFSGARLAFSSPLSNLLLGTVTAWLLF